MIETTWDNVKGENFSTFFTNDKKYFKHIDKCLKESSEYFTLIFDERNKEEGGISIRCPKNQIKPPKPVKKKNISDETKAKLSENMKIAQEARKNKNKEV